MQNIQRAMEYEVDSLLILEVFTEQIKRDCFARFRMAGRILNVEDDRPRKSGAISEESLDFLHEVVVSGVFVLRLHGWRWSRWNLGRHFLIPAFALRR